MLSLNVVCLTRGSTVLLYWNIRSCNIDSILVPISLTVLLLQSLGKCNFEREHVISSGQLLQMCGEVKVLHARLDCFMPHDRFLYHEIIQRLCGNPEEGAS